MSSLERFFSPSVRFLDKNLKSLPGSRLYFFKAGSSTLKATFADKVGDTANSNPVVADSNGIFPPIFLSGLYRVELRSKDNIVQPGWPIDNVGQDSLVVPFAPWSEIVTYNEDDVVTSADGNWYRSIVNDNLGNDPDDGGAQWEVIVIPIASNFTSDVSWATWSGAGTTISLDIDENGLSDGIGLRNQLNNTDDLHDLGALDAVGRVARYYWLNASQPANVPVAGPGYAERMYVSADFETIIVYLRDTSASYTATKASGTWGDWVPHINTAGNGIDISSSGEVSVTMQSGSGSQTVDGLTFSWAATRFGDVVTLGVRVDGEVTTGSGSVTTTAGLVTAGFSPSVPQAGAIAREGAASGEVATVIVQANGSFFLNNVASGEDFSDKALSVTFAV